MNAYDMNDNTLFSDFLALKTQAIQSQMKLREIRKAKKRLRLLILESNKKYPNSSLPFGTCRTERDIILKTKALIDDFQAIKEENYLAYISN